MKARDLMPILRFLCLVMGLVCLMTGCLAEEGEAALADDFTFSSDTRGYVLITTRDEIAWLPLPEEEEYDFPIIQEQENGTILQNLLHLTPDGVMMSSASCKNLDCVHQGEITLENREERLLFNMIICLPNQVVIELLTPEELQERMQTMEFELTER